MSTSVNNQLWELGWIGYVHPEHMDFVWAHHEHGKSGLHLDDAARYSQNWFHVVDGFKGCEHVLRAPKPPEPSIEERTLAAILENTAAVERLVENIIRIENDYYNRLHGRPSGGYW